MKYSGVRSINVRVLPELIGVVKTLSDFFGPGDACGGETIARKGRITARDGEVVDCVFVYEKDNMMGERVIVRHAGLDWEVSTGFTTPTPAQAAAVAAVIGRVV